MSDGINVLLTREEIEWIARFCQRAIRLTDMNIAKSEMKIFDTEFNENKEKALILKSKMTEALK